MFGRRVTTTAVAFLLVAMIATMMTTTANVVDAASPPCNCNKGTVQLTEPRCVCKCQADYMPPYCSFKGDDIVRVEVWFDFPMNKFISTKVIDVMKKELAKKVNSTLMSKIDFVFLKPSYNNKTLAIFDMPGMAVNWLYFYVWDAEGDASTRWPYAMLKITAVFFTEELTAAPGFVNDLLRNTYLYKDDLIQLSLADVFWAILCILVVIAIPLVEKIWGHNNAEDIEQDIAMGALDPVSSAKYKASAGASYETPGQY